jgi:hemoglobin-like flavoprotein
MALDVQMLRNSFDQALARQPNLTHVFYEELFARHPAARSLFASTDMAAQERMLAEALVAVMDHLENVPWLQSTLANLGAKHAGYGVTSKMYDWVGESLIETLAKANGEDWTAAHTARWQEAYGAIVPMILAGYPVGGGVSAAATNEAVKEGGVRRFLHFFDRPRKPTAS